MEQYKAYCNKLTKIKNQAKQKYYSKRFEESKNNLKATWKLIGTLIKRKTKGQLDIPRIVRNNKEYTNKTDIANQMNEHFINVGPNLANKIQNTNQDPTSYIKQYPNVKTVLSTGRKEVLNWNSYQTDKNRIKLFSTSHHIHI